MSRELARRGPAMIALSQYAYCLSGVLAAEEGLIPIATSVARQLAGTPSPAAIPFLHESCGHSIGARIALARHDSAAALRDLLADRGRGPADVATEPTDRYLIAELLHGLGKNDEAAGWYGSIADRSMGELPLRAMAERRLGDIAAARGVDADARTHYSHFVNLWRDADPDLRASVDSVRALIVGQRKTGRD
jgi:hypothetical protein